MRQIERLVVLSVLDQKWREHLYEMDYLREGIGLRAMAQRDPLVEYQREGFDMFNAMMDGIKEESVGNLFNRQFEIQENPIVEEVGAGAQLGFGGALPGVTAGQAPAAPATGAQRRPPRRRPPRPLRPPRAGGGNRRPRRRAFPSPPRRLRPSASGRPGAQPRAASRRQPQGNQQPGGRARGRHAANDGRGHATAAGRGQAATRSGGTHAAVVAEDFGQAEPTGRDRGRPGGRSARGRAGRARAAPSAPAPVLRPGRWRRRGDAR